MKKVLIIFGGESSEYEVSLHSVASVIKNIDREKFEILYMAITKDGRFYNYKGNEKYIETGEFINQKELYPIMLDLVNKEIKYTENEELKTLDFDIALPIVHGENSEDGLLSAVFKVVNKKIVGTKMLGSNLAMDKVTTHALSIANNILMPKYRVLNKFTRYNIEELYNQCLDELGSIMFVKPSRTGSSYGVSKVKTFEDFKNAISEAKKFDDRVLIEEAIDGVEVGCGIINDKQDFIVGEIDLVDIDDEFYDYENKYNLKNTRILCPAPIDEDVKLKVIEMAKKIYEMLDCKDYARVDMFVTKDKKIYLNELNTLPGFTSTSRFPTMMSKTGINFKDLITMLIEKGLQND